MSIDTFRVACTRERERIQNMLEALAGHAFDRGLNGRGRIAA